jgi:hypothetical protein
VFWRKREAYLAVENSSFGAEATLDAVKRAKIGRRSVAAQGAGSAAIVVDEARLYIGANHVSHRNSSEDLWRGKHER